MVGWLLDEAQGRNRAGTALRTGASRARALRRWIAVAAAVAAFGASAQQRPAPGSAEMQAQMLYQTLVGELELRQGNPGAAFELILDAARRSQDPALFERAIGIALQNRAGDHALAAARAWSTALPTAIEPLRFQAQILLAMGRLDDMAEPLGQWLGQASVVERPGLIAGLPRLLQRAKEPARAVALVEKLVAPYRGADATRTASLVALGRVTLMAGQRQQALDLARLAAQADAKAPGPVLLAIDLLPGSTEAERLVNDHLAQPEPEPVVRLAYVRALVQAQRHGDAIAQLERLVTERPQLPEPWLTLGALRLDLRQLAKADEALQRYVSLAKAAPAPASTPAPTPADDDEPAEAEHGGEGRDLTQAWLLLAQVAEQRGDLAAAEAWLARIDDTQRALEVQARRAGLLARQGQVAAARALIAAVPERGDADHRAKALAEAQLLRDVKRWRDAGEVLASANQRHADDADLLYEQAMVEEKLEHFSDMERLLRRVIELKPDSPHARNALGYSLADRGQRLPEARELIQAALALAPGDPFITDSLGWVEFRLGNHDEALRLLRQAYQSRPDIEIAIHLGEVLWVAGQRDEARRLWLEARGRDADNEVLRDTLKRLKVAL